MFKRIPWWMWVALAALVFIYARRAAVGSSTATAAEASQDFFTGTSWATVGAL